MTTSPRRQTFRANQLRRIADASDLVDDREPPLQMGDLVRLNSGRSPIMQVVDAHVLDLKTGEPIHDMITVAYRTRDRKGPRINEWDLPRSCVHRVRDAW